MDPVEWIGWLSSVVLVITLGNQVRKQWKEKSSEGVSSWLFVGQFVASAGFTAYSVLVENWVFTITNGLMVLNAIAGYVITWRNKRKSGGSADVPNLRDAEAT